ncbi:unnamed protein product [Cochlearia groenlandica]
MKLKGIKYGLLSIWIYGFLLITLSFYITYLYDRSVHISSQNGTVSPKITIFTVKDNNNKSLLYVHSWLALSSQINVVLFTQNKNNSSFSNIYGARLVLDSTIDYTFLGTPFLHSMIARIGAYRSDIAVLMDPETVLLPNFVHGLNYAHEELDRDWLLVSSVEDIPTFPFRWDGKGSLWRRDNGKRVRFGELQKMINSRSLQSDSSNNKTIMAWNNIDAPLHCGVLPPFLYQRGTYNQWIVNEAISCQKRFVFDATSTISGFSPSGNAASEHETREWELVGNSHLGQLYGSLFFNNNKSSVLPKLLNCNKGYTLVKGASIDRKVLACAGRLDSMMKKDSTLQLPFDLESLLRLVADTNRTVVLSVAGYSYKDMLMSWVCGLRRLAVTNFLVCALDEETYRFAVLQGLPVFYDPYAPKNISFDDCHFGSKCFQKVTKVKSRTVLKILKMGYNVLLSDVDVYWFKSPLPMLQSFGPYVLAAQSDEYNIKAPINRPRRLNSGFYFAHSDKRTISAMEKVVSHASTSGLSEQPSFYDTLCGEGGIYRVGQDKCIEPKTKLTVHFLDRDLFPNGAYHDLWLKKDVRGECAKRGCFVLHNNWISGRLKKLERQMMKGLWDYDASMRMCV